jgi:hypothetical protein
LKREEANRNYLKQIIVLTKIIKIMKRIFTLLASVLVTGLCFAGLEKYDFQTWCGTYDSKGGPWPVVDGGDAGFTLGTEEAPAVMHMMLPNETWVEKGQVSLNDRFAYQYNESWVDGNGNLKFTTRNKNGKVDGNAGVFAWDHDYYFSILDLSAGDKITLTTKGTITFVNANVDGISEGDAVTSNTEYTVSGSGRVDLLMAKSSFLYKVVIQSGSITPEITISPDAVTLIPGATYKFNAQIDPNTFSYGWEVENSSVASVDDDGLITAIAPGTTGISAVWSDNSSVKATATLTVANFSFDNYKLVKEYDFTSMGDITLIEGEEAGQIYNAANGKNNKVYYCTNEGLTDLAIQAAFDGTSKGWYIAADQGLTLGSGAGRCAAIKAQANQVLEILYTGEGFYTSSNDDSAAKTALNEGIGRAIYKLDADGLMGFELIKGNSVSKINIYEPGTTDAIQSIAADTESEAIYNLAGQQVRQAVRGIFLQNGKKVVK